MTMTAIFIDGPLAQEVRSLPGGFPPTYRVPLPPRETHCWCDPDHPVFVEMEAEIFTYHRVMANNKLAIYSKHDDAKSVLHAMTAFVSTDLSHTDKMIYYCRDRRAFA